MRGRPPASAEQRRARMRKLVLAPTARWTYARKATLCMALRGGVISAEEACAAHGLAPAELAAWRGAFAFGGHDALKINPRRGRACSR